MVEGTAGCKHGEEEVRSRLVATWTLPIQVTFLLAVMIPVYLLCATLAHSQLRQANRRRLVVTSADANVS